MFEETQILIKGAGDLATGVAARLWRAGFPVVLTELARPLAIRRTVAFAEAVYEGRTEVEGMEARLAHDLGDVQTAWRESALPVMVETNPAVAEISPTAVVAAMMAKRNLGIFDINDAPLVIGLGPGFVAGVDVHAVVETNRGHYLGRVIWRGSAEPDTGVPGEIGGQSRKRVIYAPVDGVFQSRAVIGTRVQEGDIVGAVGDTMVVSPAAGVLRGLIHDGVYASKGLKIGDVDPRAVVAHCFTISDKALAIGGGVLEALLAHLAGRQPLLIAMQAPEG